MFRTKAGGTWIIPITFSFPSSTKVAWSFLPFHLQVFLKQKLPSDRRWGHTSHAPFCLFSIGSHVMLSIHAKRTSV
jgi:hypothetical protein